MAVSAIEDPQPPARLSSIVTSRGFSTFGAISNRMTAKPFSLDSPTAL
jgi:hypothetical protein